MIRRRWFGLIVLLVSGAVLAACIPGAGGAGDRLVYDAAGRLVSGVDAEGKASVVRLDANGNVVGVDRLAPGALAVTAVVPAAARPGDDVWVYGVGFGASPGAQTVTVGGVGAPVAEAQPGRVRVTVGPGAVDGLVEVTVGSTTAAWSGAFERLADPPQVTSVSPAVAQPGSTVTITGSGFSEVAVENQVWAGETQLRVVAASSTSLTAEVAPGVASGPVEVRTPGGFAMGSGSSGWFVTVPPGTSPAAACVGTGSLGTAVTPGCDDGVASIEGVEPGGVYNVTFAAPCSGTVPKGEVFDSSGRLLGSVNAACGGALVKVQVLTTETIVVRVPRSPGGAGGGGVQADVCSGCAPPVVPVPTGVPTLCGCVIAAFTAIFDALVGRGRSDCADCDPVDLTSGQFVDEHLDLSTEDAAGSLALTRSYSSSLDNVGPFGRGGSHNYDIRLYGRCEPSQKMFLWVPGEGAIQFDRFGGGGYCSHVNAGLGINWDRAASTKVDGPWFGAVLEWEGKHDASAHVNIRRADGTVYRFDRFGSLERVTDRFGATTTFVRRARTNGSLSALAAVIGPTGRWLRFEYDSDCDTTTDDCRITRIDDSAGRSVTYGYDGSKRLTTFTDVAGRQWAFGYTNPTFPNKRTSVSAQPENITLLTNVYDANGRVASQTVPGQNGSALPTWTFDYTVNGSGKVTAAEATNPSGVTQEVEVNSDGFVTLDRRNAGSVIESTTTYTREPVTGMVTSVTMTDAEYPSGRTTTYAFNEDGVTWTPTGSAPADDKLAKSMTIGSSGGNLTTTVSYAPWLYGEVRGHSEPGAAPTTYSYNTAGALTAVTDPDGYTTAIEPGAYGLPVTVDGPAGTGHTEATWVHGQLIEITDAVGYTARFEHDAAGRVVRRYSPAGSLQRTSYNPDNTISSQIDPNGAATTFSWGRWGLESVTAPGSGGTISFGYGPFLRPDERVDAHGNAEHLTFADNGRPVAHTSRAGTVTEWDFLAGTDAIEQIRYGVTGTGPESTVDYTYDGAGRLESAVDSTGGTTEFSYDDLDRVLDETAALGVVAYTWDPTTATLESITANSEPATNYAWTDAGRPDTVTYDGDTTTYLYDTAGRGTGVAYPDGSSNVFELDDAGKPTKATVDAASGADREILYGYGPNGNIESLTGNNPYLVTPEFATATYDRDRLTQWAAKPITYDLDGNPITHGDQTYEWNARGELVEVNGPNGTIASYDYDAFGRRTQRVTTDPNGTATVNYLYRGNTPIVETDATSNTLATYTLGAELDGRLQQHTTNGTSSFHSDHLGSTLALTNDSGIAATTFQYTPQGQTAQIAVNPTDPRTDYRYAGQPADPTTGLTHMRARYYQPTWNRFISEDPLGIAAGTNPYQYVNGNPLGATDPHGTIAPALAACAAGGVIGGVTSFLSGGKTSWQDAAKAAAIGCVTEVAMMGAGWAFKAWRGARGSSTLLDDLARSACSFGGSTLVLMADGERRPISEIEVGDEVVSTDPETGRSSSRQVVAVLPHDDDLLVLRTSAGPIITTEDHRYWNATDGEWQAAQRLETGDRLRSEDGSEVAVVSLDWSTIQEAAAWDLDVEGFDNFYVAAGDATVLVHNCDTSHIISGSRPRGNTGAPNSIHEQVRGNGSRSITYYDDAGRAFSREDYGQLSPHGDLPTMPNGRTAPHEHQTRFNEGGLPVGKWYRELDENGRPVSDWKRN